MSLSNHVTQQYRIAYSSNKQGSPSDLENVTFEGWKVVPKVEEFVHDGALKKHERWPVATYQNLLG